jgi:uncharacterized damage-inducible protein DinB
MTQPAAWLRGPVEGIDSWLTPAALGFIQASEDCAAAVDGLTAAEVWAPVPGGAATIGFHLRHVAGTTERLLTYARGEALTPEQIASARAEADPGEHPPGAEELRQEVERAIARALEQLRATPRETLLEARAVGRAALPTTVLGAITHAAEHAQRHAGQALTTVRVLRALR